MLSCFKFTDLRLLFLATDLHEHNKTTMNKWVSYEFLEERPLVFETQHTKKRRFLYLFVFGTAVNMNSFPSSVQHTVQPKQIIPYVSTTKYKMTPLERVCI